MTVSEQQVNVPSAGMAETAHTILGDIDSPRWRTRRTDREPRILFVRILHDQDCGNPLEDCDGMGRIRALGHRDDEHTITRDAFLKLVGPLNDRELMERTLEALDGNPQPWDLDAVVLSKYEHGGVRWFVRGDPTGTQCRWDTTSIAGVWTPDDALLEEVKGLSATARRAKMEEFAQQACDEYTRWCNGECYGYEVKLYRYVNDRTDIEDYEHKKPLQEEACWGFIGSEYVEQEARATALTFLEQD